MQEQMVRGTEYPEAEERKIHIDLLRIVACFSVVALHCAAQRWYTLPLDSMDWFICNMYDAVARFGVPVFVMISGILFLERQGQPNKKKLFGKNILRLAVLYLLWNFLYSIFSVKDVLGTDGMSWKAFWDYLLYGGYHLWYLPMLIGIYALLPVLKMWLDNAEKKQIQYLLWLFFGFQVIKCTLLALPFPAAVQNLLDTVDVPLVNGYVGYFVLGHYVNHYGFTGKVRKWIYVAGICSVPGGIIGSTLLSRAQGQPNGNLYDSFSIFTFCISLSLVVFFCDKVAKIRFSRKVTGIIREVSADTLGVYLMHLLPSMILASAGITTVQIGAVEITPLLGVPLLSLFCFGACLPVAALLRRIPIVGRYIC